MKTKRQRAATPRSRTGCQTCKIRHVKCDEQRPECHQCKRTGRKCDGYTQQRPQSDVVPSMKPKLSTDHRIVLRAGSREERHYLYFFNTQTAHALSGFFESELWGRNLPQLSECEPIVRHASAAVSAAHERALALQQHSSGAVRRNNDRFIVYHYNEAIRHLMAYLAFPGEKTDLTLITCFLFVCLEMLSGNSRQALDHMEAGLKIIQRATDQTTGSNATDKELLHLGLRLNIQLAMNGRSMVYFDLESICPEELVNETPVWSNTSQARHALDILMNRTSMFVCLAGYEPTDRTHLEPQQHQLLQEFATWNRAFNALKSKPRRSAKADPRALLLLRMLYLDCWIWVKTCLSRHETVYDSFTSAFAEIVNCAAQIIDIDAVVDRKSTKCAPDMFTLETSIITGLYYTAIKCRNPIIRREAIRLLDQCTKQEGLWNKRVVAKVAQVIMELEEENLSYLPIAKRIPEEKDRIYETVKSIPVGESMQCRRQLVLLSKPNGPDGAWLTRFRFVEW
ncbi:hypothetical protein BO94DRAFT_629207 [Aspergillus sclerotioniger CBS 115572]|uniref:Zn(2)-C6 fungal-type domain-containing protein n=1 Tax=Aspergillus sclerotioniger CBS 115572 TaxID=1450535 RepID=A0A317UVL9_9EURO|nr:hypothetical protein BO94DRAFT_629207 [Aspergillus sclerotioniger CBS 115572]PWY65675.1 hypothetical protein BO94DRAFT_629207 [Aspergillus sclerotioniger CBS 115572]